MFAEASMDVVLSESGATFRFSPPLCVMLLYVYDEGGALVWRLMADEVTTVPAGKGLFIAVPLAEAPPELIAQIPLARAVADEAPATPLLSSIRYGVVPEGYRQEAPASPLSTGGYDVFVSAKWAKAASHFHVPGA